MCAGELRLGGSVRPRGRKGARRFITGDCSWSVDYNRFPIVPFLVTLVDKFRLIFHYCAKKGALTRHVFESGKTKFYQNIANIGDFIYKCHPRNRIENPYKRFFFFYRFLSLTFIIYFRVLKTNKRIFSCLILIINLQTNFKFYLRQK